MALAQAKFRLAILLAWTTFFAVACGVIASGSAILGAAFQACFLLSVGWAAVMTALSPARRRRFWTGYLVFACLYCAAANRDLAWLGINTYESPLTAVVDDAVRQFYGVDATNLLGLQSSKCQVATQAAHHTIAVIAGCAAGAIARYALENTDAD